MIFISGAAAGFFAGRLTAEQRSHKRRKLPRSSKDMKAMFQRHICKRLKLTDEQKKSAEPIIKEWLDKMDELRQKHTPEYTAVFNNFYVKIGPVLSKEQKETLEKMHKKFAKHSSPPPSSFNNTSKGIKQ